jgi:hypothetical protein
MSILDVFEIPFNTERNWNWMNDEKEALPVKQIQYNIYI